MFDCVPQFKFRRLDSADYKISKGYNFRYAKYFRENETEYRRLIKAFGVKYILSVTGQAGKFNLVPLLTNIGSGMALLGIVSIKTVIHLGTCLRTFSHLFLKLS